MKEAENMNEHKIFRSKTGFYLIEFVLSADGVGECKILIDGVSVRAGRLGKLSTSIYFLTFLSSGSHNIRIITERISPIVVKSFTVLCWEPTLNLKIAPESKAENGDRRPWFNFVLHNFPLHSLSVDVSYAKRKRDSDDVQIRINGKPIKSDRDTVKFKLWKYVGSKLLNYGSRRTKDVLKTNLPVGDNLIEFVADKMPILHSVNFDFGFVPSIPRVPTVDTPKWTGSFWDDTDEILLARLILGEAEDQSREAKIWVGGSVLNRVKSSSWPDTIRAVILQRGQYDPFKSTDPTSNKVKDPFHNRQPVQESVWFECCEIASALVSGEILNPTTATHFHGRGITKEWFMKHIVPKGKFLKKIDDTYFYWSQS